MPDKIKRQVGVTIKNYQWLNVLRIKCDLPRVNEIITGFNILLENDEIKKKFCEIMADF